MAPDIICFTKCKSVVFIQKQQPQVFYKKAILKNFAIFPWQHWRRSISLIKLQAFSLATLLKRDFKCSEIFKHTYLREHVQKAASVNFPLQRLPFHIYNFNGVHSIIISHYHWHQRTAVKQLRDILHECGNQTYLFKVIDTPCGTKLMNHLIDFQRQLPHVLY